MKEFLNFDSMLTPKFITVIFYVFSALAILAGLAGMIGGLAAKSGGGQAVLGGLVMLVFGPLFIRIWCEVVIVFFKIYDRLGEISGKLEAAEKKEGE